MPHQRTYYVYITASKSRVLYVGVTGFLMPRVLRHRSGEGGDFTRRYQVHRLVYFQTFHNVGDRDRPRNSNQEMAPRKEGRADRGAESDMGRPGRRLGRTSHDARGQDSRFLPSVGMTKPEIRGWKKPTGLRRCHSEPGAKPGGESAV